VYTGRSFATPLDLGAAWFHGLSGNVGYEMLQNRSRDDDDDDDDDDDNEKDEVRLFQSDDLAIKLYDGEGSTLPAEVLFKAALKYGQFEEVRK